MIFQKSLNSLLKNFLSKNFVTRNFGGIMERTNLKSINPHLIEMEYAVRGPLVIRAVELEKHLKEGKSLPFKSVIKANIGDAHAMGQKPITWIRQVIACCSDPSLMARTYLTNKFLPADMSKGFYPADVVERAKTLLEGCGGKSIGSYSQSTGIEVIRQDVADYIRRRDGDHIPVDPDMISLSGGASESIRNLLKLFSHNEHANENGVKSGVMIPIPQYPLYSATIVEFNQALIGYYLNEEKNWSLEMAELERSYNEATKTSTPRVLVVINPGNPTGQVLTRQNIEQIIKFAFDKNLVLFADEVYQDNVYAEGSEYVSFKKVTYELGDPIRSKLPLASFHSCSKGYMGECGLRGGYSELVNFDPEVVAVFKKSISAKLCSTVIGQIVMDLVTNPPKEGDPSYELWAKEKRDVLATLAAKASSVTKGFNEVPGVSCQTVQGAMYAFPKIDMPQKAIEKAKSLNQKPDFFYASRFLETEGVCVVPGSGFGQKEGTYHFRTTILPSVEVMQDFMERFKRFHSKFMEEFS